MDGRRPAGCLLPAVAFLLALALTGCSGGSSPAFPLRLATDRPTFLFFYTDA